MLDAAMIVGMILTYGAFRSHSDLGHMIGMLSCR